MTEGPIDPKSPVRSIAEDAQDGKPTPGPALCLSGGGYRAMVFHVGVLWRLYETDLLKDLKRISSVSGGSITAGVLALKWNALTTSAPDQKVFERELVTPIRGLAEETI